MEGRRRSAGTLRRGKMVSVGDDGGVEKNQEAGRGGKGKAFKYNVPDSLGT